MKFVTLLNLFRALGIIGAIVAVGVTVMAYSDPVVTGLSPFIAMKVWVVIDHHWAYPATATAFLWSYFVAGWVMTDAWGGLKPQRFIFPDKPREGDGISLVASYEMDLSDVQAKIQHAQPTCERELIGAAFFAGFLCLFWAAMGIFLS